MEPDRVVGEEAEVRQVEQRHHGLALAVPAVVRLRKESCSRPAHLMRCSNTDAIRWARVTR